MSVSKLGCGLHPQAMVERQHVLDLYGPTSVEGTIEFFGFVFYLFVSLFSEDTDLIKPNIVNH